MGAGQLTYAPYPSWWLVRLVSLQHKMSLLSCFGDFYSRWVLPLVECSVRVSLGIYSSSKRGEEPWEFSLPQVNVHPRPFAYLTDFNSLGMLVRPKYRSFCWRYIVYSCKIRCTRLILITTRLDYPILFLETHARHSRLCGFDRFYYNLFSFPRNQSTRSKRYWQIGSNGWCWFIKIIRIPQSSPTIVAPSQSSHAVTREVLPRRNKPQLITSKEYHFINVYDSYFLWGLFVDLDTRTYS